MHSPGGCQKLFNVNQNFLRPQKVFHNPCTGNVWIIQSHLCINLPSKPSIFKPYKSFPQFLHPLLPLLLSYIPYKDRQRYISREGTSRRAIRKSFDPTFSKVGGVRGGALKKRRFFFAKLLRVCFATSVNKLVLHQRRKFASQTPICYASRAAKEKSVRIIWFKKNL